MTLPDETAITAEVVRTPEEQAQGLMFRPYLGEKEGMLFAFEDSAPRGFWMFNTLIPLDIVWLDSNKKVVEISEMTPPCKSPDYTQCPSYGGTADSSYVIELKAGQVAAHKLKIGDQLKF